MEEFSDKNIEVTNNYYFFCDGERTSPKGRKKPASARFPQLIHRGFWVAIVFLCNVLTFLCTVVTGPITTWDNLIDIFVIANSFFRAIDSLALVTVIVFASLL